eukprot:927224-Pelagomonas_calceolata.AAC.2
MQTGPQLAAAGRALPRSQQLPPEVRRRCGGVDGLAGCRLWWRRWVQARKSMCGLQGMPEAYIGSTHKLCIHKESVLGLRSVSGHVCVMVSEGSMKYLFGARLGLLISFPLCSPMQSTAHTPAQQAEAPCAHSVHGEQCLRSALCSAGWVLGERGPTLGGPKNRGSTPA